jgi:hypothetical protein
MLSGIFQERTTVGVFFDLLILFILYVVAYRNFVSFHKDKNSSFFVWLLFLIFCLFSFWSGDWFHYREIVERIGANEIDFLSIRSDSNLEIPYYYIINVVGQWYILFRLIVWGGGLVIVYLTGKRLMLNREALGLSFSVFALVMFCYARVSLAMAIGFWGLSFFAQPIKRKKYLSYVLGATIIFFAIQFHKSALFLLVVSILSLFPIRKNFLLFIVPSFIIGVFLFNEYAVPYLLSGEDQESMVNYRVAQKYMTSTVGRRKGIFSTIVDVLRYGIFYLTGLYCVFLLIKKRKIPSSIAFYIRASVWVVLVSSIFLFSQGANASTLYYRCLNYCIIPMTFVYSYVLFNNKTNFIMGMMYLGMFSSILSILVSFFFLLLL